MASNPPSRLPSAPFIVTGELPGDILAFADALRRRHYPAERNKLAAHVTLFHSFAPSLREELARVLGGFAAEFAPPAARFEGLMDLGTGTALLVRCPALLAVREAIAEHFHGALTAQDRHEPRLHITIQNKVERSSARALQAELAASLTPRDFAFTGLGLHLYRETHWEPQATWRFRGKAGA